MGEFYPQVEPIDGDFAMPSNPVSPSVQEIDGGMNGKSDWPAQPVLEPIDAGVDFQAPSFGGMEDTSHFGNDFAAPSFAESKFGQRDDGGVEDDLEFHQSVSSVMDEGDMASRTTIAEEGVMEHHYHGEVEGLRYPHA